MIDRELFARLWAEGAPVKAMAERLGMTTGAVTAMRSRMALPSRGSPIEDDKAMDALAERVAEGVKVRTAGKMGGLTAAQTVRLWDRICASLGHQAA